MLRRTLLRASHSRQLRSVIENAPVSRAVVRRFVAGLDADAALGTASRLVTDGLRVTLDHLGEDTRDQAQAAAVRDAYVELLGRLADTGFAEGGQVEVSVKLSAIGQALGTDGERIALSHAQQICAAAMGAGTTVTLDMEDHTTTDSTLSVLRALRSDFPWVGAVLQAYLRRTEADCKDLAAPGSRVRLCKGAYDEPESVAYTEAAEVDRSYVRCLSILTEGAAYPMVATHDPRLIDIAGALMVKHSRPKGSYEYQMLYGVRPEEQRRMAARGETVRVYVPYGQEWYGYLMRRLAERPANVAFFVRSLLTKS
jgi:proline dehydrogenase